MILQMNPPPFFILTTTLSLVVASHHNVIRTANSQDLDKQWSDWSQWSPCSRSCDGGISTALRKCLSKSECSGNDERYKICNMQQCPVSIDFRNQQCADFNSKPYRDRFYEWTAFIDATDPCSLTCKAKGLNFVAKLAPKVKDGTRCRPGSLDMCVDGKCLSVGCDLQLGSLKKVDECGICGGDGQSCTPDHYLWTHRFTTNCSHHCRGGFQQSTVLCLNENTDDIVDEVFCNSMEKPNSEHRECNNFDCQPEWIVDDWSECSHNCGTGTRTRRVRCAVKHANGTVEVVKDESRCPLVKPEAELKCNVQSNDCPQWYEGVWSECSESCGNGIQTRIVACRDSKGFSSDLCELELKPIDQRICSDISRCLDNRLNSQEDSPLVNKVSSVDPSFVVGEWSPCNVTCGIGVRKRDVECKIFLEFSQTVVSIPEGQCPGQKPTKFEICYGVHCAKKSRTESLKPASSRGKKVSKYLWRVSGFSECSRLCLGGIQETLIECIDTADNSSVSSKLCNANLKPDSYTRTCNDQPCIPRWNITDFNECSKECGQGGFQTRTVRCVQEIARGTNNVVLVPDHRCGGPKPTTKQPCNQLDCSPKWVSGPWFKCSKECGGGIKTRKIRCMKEFVYGGLREVSPTVCSMKKPKILKTCNTKPCRPSMYFDSSGNELTRKSKRNNNIDYVYKTQNKVTVKVRGKAVVYEGSVVKLRCPEWNENTKQLPLTWVKGHDVIHKSLKHFLFKNVLKIKNIKVTDTGVYKCYFDEESIHSMFLYVMKRGDDVPPTEKQQPENVISDIDERKKDSDLSQEIEKYPRDRPEISLKPPLNNYNEEAKQEDSFETFTESTIKKATTEKSKQVPQVSSIQDDSTNLESRIANELSPLANANYKDLKFDWITTDWSKCTMPCGGIGFKMRLSQCYVKLENLTQSVDSSFCTDAGLSKPNTIERCGYQPCPHWKTGEWSDCDQCTHTNKGLQSRSVDCIDHNGTVLASGQCSGATKPVISRECSNEQCVPVWMTSSWSKCNAKCQESGFRSRSVYCAWKNTEKPTDGDDYCSAADQPDTTEQCFNACELID